MINIPVKLNADGTISIPSFTVPVNPDDYRFADREPYERFGEAVAKGERENSIVGWIRFIDDRRAFADWEWPEFTDALDFFDAHSEIET